MGCEWGEANHTYFQLANLFLAFTYFAPNTIKGLIVLRLLLGTAGFFFTMWATIILCSPDTFGWNFAFMIINFAHVTYLLYTMRPINFEEQNEIIYGNMFEVLGVARWQYKAIASIGQTSEFPRGEIISTECYTLCEHLTVVTSGSVRVLKNGQFIHRIQAYEFLNSPEWVASNQNGGALPIPYEVTIISEDCVILKWQRNSLRRILTQNKFLNNIFNSLIGQDVTKKLFKANKLITSEDYEVNIQTNHAYDKENDFESRRSYSMIYDATINPISVRITDDLVEKAITNSQTGIILEDRNHLAVSSTDVNLNNTTVHSKM